MIKTKREQGCGPKTANAAWWHHLMMLFPDANWLQSTLTSLKVAQKNHSKWKLFYYPPQYPRVHNILGLHIVLAKNYPAEKSSIVIKVTNSYSGRHWNGYIPAAVYGNFFERNICMYVYINIKERTLVCGSATNRTNIILNHFSIIV